MSPDTIVFLNFDGSTRENVMQSLRSQFLDKSQRVVIKVGSRLLVDMDQMDLNRKFMRQLVESIVKIRESGREVVLVSSGAVGAGMATLGLSERPQDMGQVQSCASIGQIKLSHLYETLFAKRSIHVGQILLSADDFRIRDRYKNIRNTIQSLLVQGCVPIINENDSVAVEEIKVGDNDKLSADVTQFLDADLLMIFTDENGLYNANPKEDPEAQLIPIVAQITPAILKLAGSKGSGISTGGMKTKLQAIRQATEAGCAAVMANGFKVRPHQILEGVEEGTFFLPDSQKPSSRKRWIGLVSHSKASITLDVGASKAILQSPSSVLAVGVTGVQGKIHPGDIVNVLNSRGKLIARGVSRYDSETIETFKGLRQSQIKEMILDNKNSKNSKLLKSSKHLEVIIHRNDLFLIKL